MKKNTTEKKEQKENKLTWINDAFAVSHVNNYSDDVTFFVLHVKTEIGEMTISDCKVISMKEGGYFVSFPSKKQNDKYYSIVFVKLTDEIQDSIIETVGSMI